MGICLPKNVCGNTLNSPTDPGLPMLDSIAASRASSKAAMTGGTAAGLVLLTLPPLGPELVGGVVVVRAGRVEEGTWMVMVPTALLPALGPPVKLMTNWYVPGGRAEMVARGTPVTVSVTAPLGSIVAVPSGMDEVPLTRLTVTVPEVTGAVGVLTFTVMLKAVGGMLELTVMFTLGATIVVGTGVMVNVLVVLLPANGGLPE